MTQHIAQKISDLIFDNNEDLITVNKIKEFADTILYKYEHDFDLLIYNTALLSLDNVIFKTSMSAISGTYQSKEGSVTVNMQNYDPSQCWRKAKKFLMANPQYVAPSMSSCVGPIFGGV
ncbi:hypothetical protein GLP37_21725 [Photobacterium phosphoreum]|uniref:hypothetical protein n=1 Tax=Photobacterium phosphoreum TaxID=659 RepID=UPI001E46F560|nr:hypothetical protein [Photobacterium phosphoreum]MCD9504786.1 hypothetical protein [Photobacterium phosphoreum]